MNARPPSPPSGAAAAALASCPAFRDVTLSSLRLTSADCCFNGPGISALALSSSASLTCLRIGIDASRGSAVSWCVDLVDSPSALAGVIKQLPIKFPNLAHLSIATPTVDDKTVREPPPPQRASPWAKAPAKAASPAVPAAARDAPWGAAAVAAAPLFERGAPFESLTSMVLSGTCAQAPDGLAPSIEGLVAPKLKKLTLPAYTCMSTKLIGALGDAVSSGRCPVLKQTWSKKG